jgi:hypothetical protein
MVVGQHEDGRIFLMAQENGVPSMIRKDGKWEQIKLTAEELMEFTPIRDSETRLSLLDEAEKALDIIQAQCICPRKCDCANSDGEGVASKSNFCTEHNLYPPPVDECPAEVHKGGQRWNFYF